MADGLSAAIEYLLGQDRNRASVTPAASRRRLRALRATPPGHAERGARRSTFQSALEQCEQFLNAARTAGYATRPVHLFYAISQGGRAMVAASPRIENQAWRVHGHGLVLKSVASTTAESVLCSTGSGLFSSVARSLSMEPLAPNDPVALGDIWPNLPEASSAPLVPDPVTPALPLDPKASTFAKADLRAIPLHWKKALGDDQAKTLERVHAYPALREARLGSFPPMHRFEWRSDQDGLKIGLEWREPRQLGEGGSALFPDNRTIRDLGIIPYRGANDLFVTPAVGSMGSGLHPLLALWATLLALSSFARYEPAAWSKFIDIDRSLEANAIEHILDEAVQSIPATLIHHLTSFAE